MTLRSEERERGHASVFASLRDRTALGRLLLAIVVGVAFATIVIGVLSHIDSWLVKLLIPEPIWLVIGAAVLLALHLLYGQRVLTAFREYRLSYQLGQPSVTALDIGAATCLSAVCTLVLSLPTQNWRVLGLLVDTRFVTLLVLLIHITRLITSDPLATAVKKLEGLTEEQASLLSEAPIVQAADDALGRMPFVRALSSEIIRWTVTSSTQGTVFGLYGGWGQGKSSVMNLLCSELETQHDSGVLVVQYDPWRFVGPEALVTNFGTALSQVMTGQLGSPSAGRSVLLYTKTLVREASIGPFRFSLPTGTPINSDVCEALSHALEDSGRYLVVLVDEVDRLERDELVALFSLVRSAFSTPRVTFVLAMEPNTVLDALGHSVPSASLGSPAVVTSNKNTGSSGDPVVVSGIPRELLSPGIEEPSGSGSAGHAWLDKVVAHPFYLPRIAPSAVEAMLHSLLVTAGFAPAKDDEFWKPIASIVAEYVVGLLRSPRQLKRFCVSLGSAWQRSLNSDEVPRLNGQDLFFLEVIGLFFPRAINDIWENNGFYIDPESWNEIFRFFSIRDDTGKHIREHVLTLCTREPNGFSLLGMLRYLFPKVDAAMQHYPSTAATPSESAYRDRRIYHPECFPFYFRDPTEGELTTADVKRCIHMLNSLEGNASPKCVEQVITPLLNVNEDRRKTIGLLKHFASEVRAPVRYDLATVLIERGCGSIGEVAMSWFLYAIDFEAPPSNNPSADLAHLQTRFPALPRLIDVALFGTAACIELKSWTSDASVAADATSNEVERRLYDISGLPIDIVTQSFVDEQLGQIIMRWFDGWGLDHNRLKETSRYLVSLARNDVGGLVNLLRWYRPRDHRDDGSFHLEALRDHFGWQAVLECLEIALKTSSLAESQIATLEALKAEMLAAAAKSVESDQEEHTGPEGSQ